MEKIISYYFYYSTYISVIIFNEHFGILFGHINVIVFIFFTKILAVVNTSNVCLIIACGKKVHIALVRLQL